MADFYTSIRGYASCGIVSLVCQRILTRYILLEDPNELAASVPARVWQVTKHYSLQPESAGINRLAFDSSRSLAAWLRGLRCKSGLTLDQFADVLGVSKPTVWAWENGKAKPRPQRLLAIATTLGVAHDDLLHAIDVESRPEELAGRPLNDEKRRATMISTGRELIAKAHNIDPAAVRIMIEL